MKALKVDMRNASTSDAVRLLGIYAYYVEKTAISFECTVLTLGDFSNRIENTRKRYPKALCQVVS